MLTVSEVSRISGVSVRTLHHYDAIGLLKPTEVTAAGYRLYDDAALSRLQCILLLRELRFPLRDIAAVIDSPGFDRREAISAQIELLELQRSRIDRLIALARRIRDEGADIMDFDAFDKSDIENFSAEVKERWGDTDAYREYESRPDAGAGAADDMMRLFARFGTLRHGSPDSPEAQAAVESLRQHITANYYTCTPQILGCLGDMYTADDRFRANIDSAGGDGTAQFASDAIRRYCADRSE